MVSIGTRAVILSVKLLVLGFLYSHMVFEHGLFYFEQAMLFAPVVSFIGLFLLLDEVDVIIDKKTNA